MHVAKIINLDTHMHNDYISGGLVLARTFGARYVTSADDDVKFDRVAVRDREVINIGSFAIQTLHTSGRPDLLGRDQAATLAGLDAFPAYYKYFDWLFPYGEKLARIGIDRPDGALVGDLSALRGGLSCGRFIRNLRECRLQTSPH